MFNDHIVSVSPLFWIILGIGIGINVRLTSKMVSIKDEHNG